MANPSAVDISFNMSANRLAISGNPYKFMCNVSHLSHTSVIITAIMIDLTNKCFNPRRLEGLRGSHSGRSAGGAMGTVCLSLKGRTYGLLLRIWCHRTKKETGIDDMRIVWGKDKIWSRFWVPIYGLIFKFQNATYIFL